MSKELIARDKATGQTYFITGKKERGFVELAMERQSNGCGYLYTGTSFFPEKNIEYLPDYEPEEPGINIIPAIERMEEYLYDYHRVEKAGSKAGIMSGYTGDFAKELYREALLDFNKKWGLNLDDISTETINQFPQRPPKPGHYT